MKSVSSSVFLLTTALVSTALVGCTTSPMSRQEASKGSMPMSHNEMMAMCDMHEQMMSAKTPEERRALMAEHMKTMPPEMRQRHMQMMREQMQMMQEGMGTQTPTK